MKVVYLTNSIGNKSNGGSSLSGLRFMQLLNAKFGFVELVTDEWRSPPKSSSEAKVHLVSLKPGLPVWSLRGMAKQLVFWFINLFRKKEVVIDCAGGSALVFVNSFTDLDDSVRLTNYDSLCRFCVVRGDVSSFEYQPWGDDLGIEKPMKFLNSFDALIYVSQTIQKNWIAAGVKAKPYYLPNAIDESEAVSIAKKSVGEIRRKLELDSKAFHVVVVGSLQQRKGQDLFVEIANQLGNRVPNIQVHFIGGISSTFGGVEISKELASLGSKYIVHGHKDNALEYVYAADVAVSTSRSEAFPRTVAEYLALGKAIISTRVAGADEMIDADVNGLLVEIDDARAIANGLVYLHENRERLTEFEKAARQKYLENYSIQSQQKNFDTITDDILSDPIQC